MANGWLASRLVVALGRDDGGQVSGSGTGPGTGPGRWRCVVAVPGARTEAAEIARRGASKRDALPITPRAVPALCRDLSGAQRAGWSRLRRRLELSIPRRSGPGSALRLAGMTGGEVRASRTGPGTRPGRRGLGAAGGSLRRGQVVEVAALRPGCNLPERSSGRIGVTGDGHKSKARLDKLALGN